MNTDILLISFSQGIKEKTFQLPLNSYQKLEAAGQVVGYKYELDVYSMPFIDFYKYVRDKFGVLYENKEVLATKAFTADKAIVEQKKGEPGQPWTHLLTVLGTFRVEKITFYPDECQRENEEEDLDYQEEEKRADLIKSIVTTLPEEYRDTDISEKPLDRLIRLTGEADLYKYGKDYKE